MIGETLAKSWKALVADPKHGPMPALLVILTVVTGLVDAVSILALGRVFVANMTGNVVFIGFALAGAPGFSLSASLFALGGFLVGAFAGGGIVGREKANRARLLIDCVVIELVLFAVAAGVTQVASVPYSNPVRDGVAAVLATSMGIQNAVARRLAVPDLTTTVLTMTLTGLASEIRARNTTVIVRRMLAVLAMLGGALAGGALVVNVRPSTPLEIATGLIAVVAIVTLRAARVPAPWQNFPSPK